MSLKYFSASTIVLKTKLTQLLKKVNMFLEKLPGFAREIKLK